VTPKENKMTPPNITEAANPAISHFEISRLACLNWQNDGCPQGRDLDYWLAAERQLKASGPQPNEAVTSPAKVKSERRKSKVKEMPVRRGGQEPARQTI
jgi:hypothetical protein